MDGCYETYLSCCRPYRLPPPWDFLPADPTTLEGPAEPSAALKLLAEKHSPDALITSGLAARNADGELRVSPALSGGNTLIVVLQDSGSSAATNLLTNRGCLAGDEPPFLAVLKDRQTVESLDISEGRLVLAGNLPEAVLLRALGLPAAPVQGLADLDARGLQRLGKAFGIPCAPSRRERDDAVWAKAEASLSPVQRVAAGSGDPLPADENSESEKAETSREIVLADWSLPALSRESPAEIERAICHLCNLARYRRLDLSSVSIWTPANADLEGIRFVVEQREEKWVRDAIRDSLQENMQSVNRPHGFRAQRDEQLDLATATERLSEELLKNGSDESSRRRLRDAESNYRRLAVAEVVKPLLHEAQTAMDPVERMQQIQLAHLANMFLMKFPGVLREEVGGTAAEVPGRQHQRATSELLMTSKQITVLAGEQIRCKQFSKIRLRTVRPRTIDAPPLRNLGSTTKS
jgi:hypothetical protein